jgi:hypothetical protein
MAVNESEHPQRLSRRRSRSLGARRSSERVASNTRLPSRLFSMCTVSRSPGGAAFMTYSWSIDRKGDRSMNSRG